MPLGQTERANIRKLEPIALATIGAAKWAKAVARDISNLPGQIMRPAAIGHFQPRANQRVDRFILKPSARTVEHKSQRWAGRVKILIVEIALG